MVWIVITGKFQTQILEYSLFQILNLMTAPYATLTEALDDLKKRGYTLDFDLEPTCIKCAGAQLQLHPEEFEVKEFYRFEGASSPDDNDVVYAIEGKNGQKGVLTDAYGAYAEPSSAEMITKLRMHP